MRTGFVLAVLLQVFSLHFVFSQDIHWSQINQIQSFQNPANIGEFKDEIKFTLAVKDQWRSVSKPYQTILGSIDTKIRKLKNISLAGNLLSDVTGDGSFRTNQIDFIAKYDILKFNRHILSLGIDLGLINKTIDFSNFKYDNQFDGYKYNATYSSNENLNVNSSTNFNLGLGISSRLQINSKNNLTISYGLYNINQPKESFYQMNILRPIRNHFLVAHTYHFSKYNLVTSLNYNHQLVYNEFLLGSILSITTKNLKFHTLYSGLYFRFNDAIILNLGTSIRKFKCILSYDVNISKLVKASNGRGSLELTIQYLMSKQKIKLPIQPKCSDYY